MTDEDDQGMWPQGMFQHPFQAANEDVVDQQRQLFQQWMSMMSGSPTRSSGFPGITPPGMGMATFKTRVQSGGRISIPDAEREALDIEEGDIVQAVIVPIQGSDSNE